MDLDSFAGMLAGQMQRPDVPVEQQLAELKKLGIAIPDEQEKHFLQRGAYYARQPFIGLLHDLGRGDSGDVLTFDVEAEREETMYRDLLTGLLRLTGGGLGITDVAEDGGDEARRLSFTLARERHVLEFPHLGAFLDTNVLPRLNEVLTAAGVEKRFLWVEDMHVPGTVVFFRTPQWGLFLAAATKLRVLGG